MLLDRDVLESICRQTNAAQVVPQMEAHIGRSGVQPICAWRRATTSVDVHEGTAELSPHFYHYNAGCRPATFGRGTNVTMVSVQAPDSEATQEPAAKLHLMARMCATARGHMAECPSAGGAPTDRRCASRATTSS